MTDVEIKKSESESGGRYHLLLDGHEAEMTYSKAGENIIIIDHTGVPEGLAGRGVGASLVLAAVKDARQDGFRIVPLCPFARAQFDKHEEWKDVLK